MSLEELNGYFETAKAAALAAGEVRYCFILIYDFNNVTLLKS